MLGLEGAEQQPHHQCLYFLCQNPSQALTLIRVIQGRLTVKLEPSLSFVGCDNKDTMPGWGFAEHPSVVGDRGAMKDFPGKLLFEGLPSFLGGTFVTSER